MKTDTKIRQDVENMLDGEFPEIRKFYEDRINDIFYTGEYNFLVTAITEMIENKRRIGNHKLTDEHTLIINKNEKALISKGEDNKLTDEETMPDWKKDFDECFSLSEFTEENVKYYITLLLSKTSEEARQEGYEVGYAQANTESGMPISIVEQIKRSAISETLDRAIASIPTEFNFSEAMDGQTGDYYAGHKGAEWAIQQSRANLEKLKTNGGEGENT